MPKPSHLLRHLLRSALAASLPCLLAAFGLAGCELTPHRVEPGSAAQQSTDSKSYAQVLAQQQRPTAPRATLPPAQQQAAATAPAVPTAASAPASTDSQYPGAQAMLSASNEVLATRLRDQPATAPQAAGGGKAAAPAPDTTAAKIAEPPVVQVMRGDQEIRIPPTRASAVATAPAPALPPPAATVPAKAAAAAPAVTPPPAPARAEAPPQTSSGRAPGTVAAITPAATPAAAPASNPQPASPPPSAPAPVAAQGSNSALYGMPLPNLPSLRNPDGGTRAETTQTQLAQADTGSAPTAEAAQYELKQAQNRIHLSDEQLQELQAGQDHIASGDNGGAYLILHSLNAELEHETRTYVVKDNESMWHVAGQQQVYGNSYLWPLVWQANRDKVKKPSHLYKGMKLIIPAHPTAQEVGEALAYSKTNNLEGMNQADSQ